MTEDKHHIDNYFKQELSDLNVPAPPSVWENIESHLDHKKKARIFTFWSALAAGLALLIGVSTYMSYEKTEHRATGVLTLSQPKETSPSNTSKNKPIGAGKQSIVANRKSLTPEISKKSNVKQTSVDILAAKKHNISVKVPEIANSIAVKPNANSNENTIIKEKFSNGSHKSGVLENSNSPYKQPLVAKLRTNTKNNLIIQTSVPQTTSITLETEAPFDAITENINVPTIKKWSITGQLAPLYSYRTSNQSYNTDNNKEKGLMSYSGGLKVDYKASQRFSIQVGVYYNAMGQKVDNIKVTTYPTNIAANNVNTMVLYTSNSLGPVSTTGTPEVNTNLFYSYLTADSYNNATASVANRSHVTNTTKNGRVSTNDGSMIQKLNFVEIPLLARFKIIDKKISLHMIGGISTNLLVGNNVIFKQDGTSENIGQTSGINTVNYSSTVGIGINYGLFKKLDLSIEPTYKYYLKSISNINNVDFKPYSFGVFTGFVYKF